MTKITGGPAFPTTRYDHGGEHDGMSLRDYFAAKAMQADVSRFGYHRAGNPMPNIAINAYEMADAMLAERDKV